MSDAHDNARDQWFGEGVLDLSHLDQAELVDVTVTLPEAEADGVAVTMPHRFTPRTYQCPTWDALFRHGFRRLGCEWHRRAGKDRLGWNMLLSFASIVPGFYLYLLPTNVWARKVIWDGIGRDGFRYIDHLPAELGSKYVSTMRCEFHRSGAIVTVAGCDNPDSYRGSNPRGVVLSEYSQHSPEAYDVLRPVLAENGGWLMANWTPRGKNHAWELRQTALRQPGQWHFTSLDVSATTRPDGQPVICQEDIDQELADGMPESLALQEFWLSYEAPNPGAFYGDELRLARRRGRIGFFPPDPRLPVSTFWDLGMGDHTAVWCCQFLGEEVRAVFYLEDFGKAFPHYFAELSRWASENNLRWGKHFGPHDLEVREFSSGRSRIETARKAGFPMEVVPRWNQHDGLDVSEGIEAVRALFPRMFFHEPGTQRGLSALADYKRRWDEREARFTESPAKNWACHGADAFRMLACSYRPAWGSTWRSSSRRGPARMRSDFDALGG